MLTLQSTIMFLRLSAIAFILLLTTGLQAQEPEQKNTPLLYKITATWCGPCGSWGWDLANEIQEARGDDILYMGIFNSSQATMNNTAFYNSTAVTLGFNFRYTSWPSFGVNGLNLTDKNQANGVLDIEGIKQDCYDSLDAFIQQEVVANAASEISAVNDTLKVRTQVRFFEKAAGTYYLASYIVEQNALNYQNQQQGIVAHKGVLRGTLDSLDWGRVIVEDSIAQDSTLTFDYIYGIQEQDWVTDNLVIYNIIWKREGSKYRYVNGSQTRVNPATDISNTPDVQELAIYPNPVQQTLRVKGFADHRALAYVIYDITGKVSLRGTVSSQTPGIHVAALPQGMYLIQFKGIDGTTLVREWVKL